MMTQSCCPTCKRPYVTQQGLTPRQRELLNFITHYIWFYDFSPNFEEIQAALGLKSKSSVHRLLMELRERGYIRLTKNHARSISIIEHARVA